MEKNKRPKIFRGKVASDRMTKTRVILIERYKKVPKYGKYVKISKKVKAHDEEGKYREGDRVEIQEVSPMSRDKRWKIIRLIERPLVADEVLTVTAEVPAIGEEKA